jgi:PilZ domain
LRPELSGRLSVLPSPGAEVLTKDALEYFATHQPVRLSIPGRGDEEPLETVVKTARTPFVEVRCPSHLVPAAAREPDAVWTLSCQHGDSIYFMQGCFISAKDHNHLFIEVLLFENRPQQRRYFRIDTEVFIRHWAIGQGPAMTGQPERKPVNLSAVGLRFTTQGEFQTGQLVGLELSLPEASPVQLKCFGKVIRVVGKGNHRQELALELVELETRDQERLIQFCLAEQRRQLRMKVRVLDPYL